MVCRKRWVNGVELYDTLASMYVSILGLQEAVGKFSLAYLRVSMALVSILGLQEAVGKSGRKATISNQLASFNPWFAGSGG